MTDLQPTTPATADAIAAANAYPFDFPLPSGKTGTVIRPLKGRDMAMAQLVVPDHNATVQRSFATVAPVVKVDGKPVVMEDLMEMDLDDALELMEKAQGKAPVSTPKP